MLTPISVPRTERPVPTGPVIGLVAQVAVLGGLAAVTPLGPAGALAALGYGVVVCAVLTRAVRRAGSGHLGPADWVTLARATLVGGVTALVVDSFAGHTAPAGVLFALAAVALLLDSVDGQVARRTGTASTLGARFDVEVDAFLVLVLSLYATHGMGSWVLAVGVARYAFLGSAQLMPWLRRPLPPRFWRKVVAATQGVVLAVVAAQPLPRPVLLAALVAVLIMLAESFGRDVVWLWHHREVRAATQVTATARTP